MADQRTNDTTSDIMWAGAAIMGILMLIGYFYGTQITMFYLTIKLKQAQLLHLIFPVQYFQDYIELIETRPLKDWKLKEVLFVGGRVSYISNIPFVALVAYFTYKIWDKNPLKRFQRVLSMNTLKESEQRIWPYIAPVVEIDLMKESFSSGPYAMAMKPYDFAIKYHLLQEEKNVNSLDRKRTEKLFVSQLGRPFDGIKKLKKHELAIIAVFAAHGCGDKDGAIKAINEMAITAAKKGIKKMPDFSAANDLFKHLEHPDVKEVLSKHSYVYTLIAQMLEFSRRTGVMPPSYFVWLKPRDRTLWYIIDCVGRQVPFVEVAGIFGHWRAEQTAKHKIDTPFVTKAVDGLERALGEVKIN